MDYRLLTENLSMERLDGEVIAIDFTTGRYYSFEGPAADVIHLLENSVPRAQWRQALVDQYEMVPEADDLGEELNNFLEKLVENELVSPVISLQECAVVFPNDGTGGVWSSPTFMVNDELVDLLVIDPIHESGDRGWPQEQS